MFAKDGEGDKEGGDRKVMMAGDGGEERILEIAPPPTHPWDMRSFKRWQKMACGRDRMRAAERERESS